VAAVHSIIAYVSVYFLEEMDIIMNEYIVLAICLIIPFIIDLRIMVRIIRNGLYHPIKTPLSISIIFAAMYILVILWLKLLVPDSDIGMDSPVLLVHIISWISAIDLVGVFIGAWIGHIIYNRGIKEQ
jgi:hypothetical protein